MIGPGDTIILPEYTVPWMFMHEAELALVIKGPAKMVKAKNWKNAVFGYTAMIDVSAREQRPPYMAGDAAHELARQVVRHFRAYWSCIVTADEVKDPNDLIVRLWNNGQLRHNYNTDDMEHRVPELGRSSPSTVMTMNSGDLIACGTNHEGLGALQDGETARDRDSEHRQNGTQGFRPSEKKVGARYLYGCRFHQSRRGQAAPPPVIWGLPTLTTQRLQAVHCAPLRTGAIRRPPMDNKVPSRHNLLKQKEIRERRHAGLHERR